MTTLSKEIIDNKINDILNESLALFASDLFISYEDVMSTECGKELTVLLFSVGIHFNEEYPRFAHNILYFTVPSDSEIYYDNGNTKEKLVDDVAANLTKYIIISVIENVCFHKFQDKHILKDSLVFRYKTRNDKILSSQFKGTLGLSKTYKMISKRFENTPLDRLIGISILSDELNELLNYGIFVAGMNKINNGTEITVSVPKMSHMTYNGKRAEGQNCAQLVENVYGKSKMPELFGKIIKVKCRVRDEDWTVDKHDDIDALNSMTKCVLSDLISKKRNDEKNSQ